ncbi:MAG TPA: FYVE zinc finger domain-containing protein [Acidimicrobiales bacterium]|nr:FYVE zinc finger domain-containing protein [Acidimicrobiales bacterium]
MAHLCMAHPSEHAEGLCRRCGGPFCADCLVYPFGPVKPPFCIPCAVKQGGVRTTAGNRQVVQPKENKQRLKEWRKARKRDLNSPPPDGVATWQRMDEAEADEARAAADSRRSVDRDALLLPPPEPETPTPPPGVNLAPPGASDWREEFDVPVSANFGPPGSSYEAPQDEPLLGYAPPDDSPLPDLGPAPVPEAESIGVDIGFGDPTWAPLASDPGAASEPFDSSAFSLGFDEPVAAPPTEQPFTLPGTPAATPAPAPAFGTPAAHEAPAAEQPFTLPRGFEEPAPAAPRSAQEPPSPYDTGRVTTAVDEPFPAFDPPPAAPVAFEHAADPLATFGTTAPAEPTSFAPPAPVEPTTPTYPPVPSPEPDPLSAFGLGGGDGGFAPPSGFDEPLPPPAVPQVHDLPAAEPSLTTPLDQLPPPAIRPPTPTRIPAAPPQEKAGDAKAMLARIAALRGDKD